MRHPDLALIALLVAGLAPGAAAQELGPQRRFIAVGPYAGVLSVDRIDAEERTTLGGFGGRLTINLAPLSGPGRTPLDFTTVGGYYLHYVERDGLSATHVGGEVNVHLVDVPIGYLVDPFVLVGVGALRTETDSGTVSDLVVSPGAGLRVALPGLFELRIDGRDVIVLDSNTGPSGEGGVTHNPEVTAGLNVRF